MSMYREQLQVSRIFPGNKLSSFLGHAQLPQHPPRHQADPGLGRLLPKRISRIEQREDVSFADKLWCRETIGYSWWKTRVFSTRRSSWLLWGKMRQSINSSTSFALSVIAPNVVSRELLGPAKRARKTVKALTEARVLWRRIDALVNVHPNR